MQLYVARHGETELNAQQRYQGSSDYPLNEQGLAQARELAARLPAGITRVVASPLLRAQQTAQAVSDRTGVPVVTIAGFRERCYGAFEGLNREQTIERYPDLIARRIAQQWDDAPPGGETMRQAVGRVEQALLDLHAQQQGQVVLLVAHGFVARAVRWLLLRAAEDAFYAEPMIDNCEFQHYPLVRPWR
ncbi:MAG: histidine phosphatase family protein [Aquabacterium sp.]|jgi:broad specificity phosphatase PhoE|nr:MAG: histidine phosphatase family protein [Aquabacterium sp.]